MPGPPPHGSLRLAFFFKIVRPFYFPVIRIQAKEITLGPETIDFSFAYERRHTRAGWIAHRVGAIIFISPNLLPVRGIETNHAFAALNHTSLEWIGWIAHA